MPGSDVHHILVRIARMYYDQELTQLDISRRLRISRQKVQRMLVRAKQEGIVRISIIGYSDSYTALEEGLESKYGLREAVVTAALDPDDQDAISRDVGSAAASYLIRIVDTGDCIATSWGGTILSMVNSLAYGGHRIESVSVVQALGGLANMTNETHATEITRRLALALGGTPFFLPAPGVAASRRAHEAFLDDPQVSNTLSKARTATIVLAGIGVPRPESLLVQEGSIVRWEELDQLLGLGAVGDINLRFFDNNGAPIQSDLNDRVIGMTLDDIKQVPTVVALAGGPAKLNAIHAAATAGLINVLITDNFTAQALLADHA